MYILLLLSFLVFGAGDSNQSASGKDSSYQGTGQSKAPRIVLPPSASQTASPECCGPEPPPPPPPPPTR
jgi:hypothetical protein